MFDTEHTVVVKVRSCNLKLWHKLRIVPEFSRTSRASSRYKLLKLERPEDLPSGLKAATSWKYFRMIQRAMSIGDSSSRTRKSRTLLSLVKRRRAVDKSPFHSLTWPEGFQLLSASRRQATQIVCISSPKSSEGDGMFSGRWTYPEALDSRYPNSRQSDPARFLRSPPHTARLGRH
jgi:hypothetical protein